MPGSTFKRCRTCGWFLIVGTNLDQTRVYWCENDECPKYGKEIGDTPLTIRVVLITGIMLLVICAIGVILLVIHAYDPSLLYPFIGQ